MKFPSYKHETQKHSEGFKYVAGCDEVGIGPLAGPVVAASVILDPATIVGRRSKNKWWGRIRDSKTTNEKERQELFKSIMDNCLVQAIGIVSQETIDQINIHQASMLAMKKSVSSLKQQPDFLFIDGLHMIKDLGIKQQAVIDGDVKLLSIAAASIVAKFTRDEMLLQLHETYPMYGFDKHKGYPTKFHREAIRKYGVLPAHRRSFAFVAQCLNLSRRGRIVV